MPQLHQDSGPSYLIILNGLSVQNATRHSLIQFEFFPFLAVELIHTLFIDIKANNEKETFKNIHHQQFFQQEETTIVPCAQSTIQQSANKMSTKCNEMQIQTVLKLH